MTALAIPSPRFESLTECLEFDAANLRANVTEAGCGPLFSSVTSIKSSWIRLFHDTSNIFFPRQSRNEMKKIVMLVTKV